MKFANQISVLPSIPHQLPKLPKLDPTLLSVSVLGILFLGLSIIQGRAGKSGKTATARWATDGELNRCRKTAKAAIAKPKFNKAAYYITEPIGNRPVSPQTAAGRMSKLSVLLPQINRGMLVTGGAGSGKTANAILPMIMSSIRQGFSCAVYDYKFGEGGIAEQVVPYAISQGYKVRMFAPGFDVSQSYNLLERIKDERDLAGAKEQVEIISENTGESGAKKDAFFDPAGISVLSGAFLMAKWVAKQENNPDLGNILMVNQILALPNLSKRLLAAREKIEPWVLSSFSVLTSSSGSEGKNVTEAGILANAVKTLAPIVMPNFLPAFCGESNFPNFHPEDLLKVDGKELVIFGVDKSTRASTIPLVAVAMQQIISYNLRPGRTSPLVIALDEFPTLSLKVVLNWLNEERYNGASIIVGVQYLGQVIARYGKDWSDGFLASCATKFWFDPGEDNTAQYISKSLGETELEIENKSKTFNSGKNSGNSRSSSHQLHKKPLIEAHAIRQFPQGTCIVESPGVGSTKTAGVPFLHQFRFSEGQAKSFEEKSRDDFKKIRDLIVEHQPPDRIDYTQKLAEYNAILERLLPVDPVESKGGATELPHILGKTLFKYFPQDEEILNKLKVEPDKKYYLPPEIVSNGKISIEIEEISQLLTYTSTF